jgi:hypothetical protein
VRWTPGKEQFCQEKAAWVGDLGKWVGEERWVTRVGGERVAEGGAEQRRSETLGQGADDVGGEGQGAGDFGAGNL